MRETREAHRRARCASCAEILERTSAEGRHGGTPSEGGKAPAEPGAATQPRGEKREALPLCAAGTAGLARLCWPEASRPQALAPRGKREDQATPDS